MMNRRDFLRNSAAGAALIGVGGYVPGVTPVHAAPMHSSLDKAIYDERFRDSVAFAREAETLRIPTHAIRGDITDLWFKDLDLRWRRDRAMVAGLTTECVMFCLEQLAWTHHMRVVYRAEHVFLPSGRVAHAFHGSERARAQAGAFDGNDSSGWAPRVAHVIASVAADPASRRGVTSVLPAPPRDDQDLLVSWVIASVS